MTRAEEELILVCGPNPSQFLKEIPEQYIRQEHPAQPEEAAETAVQISLFEFM